MKLLTAALSRLPEFQELLTAIEGGRSPAALTGVAAIHRAHMAAGIALLAKRPIVVVCSSDSEGEQLRRDLTALTGEQVPLLTPREFTFHSAASVSRQWEHRRLSLFRQLVRGEVPVLVATVESLLQRTMPTEVLEQCGMELKLNDSRDLNQLCETLTAAGYTRADQVEAVGQFALRGGILDVFSPGADRPVRVEFWGDEVDTMGWFDPESQRRIENVEQVTLLPAAEALPRLAPGGLAGLGEKSWKNWRKKRKRAEIQSSPPICVKTGRRCSPAALSRPLTAICPSSTPN